MDLNRRTLLQTLSMAVTFVPFASASAEAAGASGSGDRRRILLRGGYVATVDKILGDLPVGDVLIDGNVIANVGTGIPVGDAQVIDVRGKLVMARLYRYASAHVVDDLARNDSGW